MSQSTPEPLDETGRLSLAVEAWKQTVEVQQHFNDLELRIRNFAVTALGALAGAVAFSMQQNLSASVFGIEVAATKILLTAGLVIWGAFYVMDRHWYHRLLKGAVAHGEMIEKRNRHLLPELDLTASISAVSPTKLFGREIHSSGKMDLFYGLGAAIILMGLIALGPPSLEDLQVPPKAATAEVPPLPGSPESTDE